MTLVEIEEAVIANLELRADLLAQKLSSTDDVERAQFQAQIQATVARADELATLQSVLSVVATLRSPPPKPPKDPDLVSILQERAVLLEQSAAAADKAARDLLQAQISLNTAKADDIEKLRSVQKQLASADAVAADADVALVP